jgi:TonB family protein
MKVPEATSEQLLPRRFEPAYPEAALQKCLQGDVVLSVIVAENGYVKSAQAISGPVDLRGAAEAAVIQWAYAPHLLNGKAVEYETLATIRFRLPKLGVSS